MLREGFWGHVKGNASTCIASQGIHFACLFAQLVQHEYNMHPAGRPLAEAFSIQLLRVPSETSGFF